MAQNNLALECFNVKCITFSDRINLDVISDSTGFRIQLLCREYQRNLGKEHVNRCLLFIKLEFIMKQGAAIMVRNAKPLFKQDNSVFLSKMKSYRKYSSSTSSILNNNCCFAWKRTAFVSKCGTQFIGSLTMQTTTILFQTILRNKNGFVCFALADSDHVKVYKIVSRYTHFLVKPFLISEVHI